MELESQAVPTLHTGLSRFIRDFPPRLPGLKHIEFRSLDRPRWSPDYFRVRYHRKKYAQSRRFGDLLIRLARKRAVQRGDASSILVNFPQAFPAPERETGFSVMIHDLNWLHYPGNFNDPDTTDRWCRQWVERAHRVVAVSEFTRAELIEHYQCPPEKIVAAPLAPFDEVETTPAGETLAGLGLVAGRFYFYPAIWGMHKGQDVLTSALEQAGKTDPVVVTLGDPAKLIDYNPPGIASLRASLVSRWPKLVAQKRLVVLDNLSETAMQTLRLHCKAFVLPSQFEGFGFPMVEAVYLHRPAIVAEIPAYTEILRRYPQYRLATLFPPKSSETLAGLLNNQPLPSPSMPAGWQQGVTDTWSWRHMVGRLMDATRVV